MNSKVSKILLFSSIYYFSLCLLDAIYIATLKLAESETDKIPSALWNVLLVVPFVLFLAAFIHLRVNVKQYMYRDEPLLFSLFGFTVISNAVLNFALGKMHLLTGDSVAANCEVLHVSTFCLVGLMLFVALAVLKAKYFLVIPILYYAINFLYFSRPELIFGMNEQTITHSTNVLFDGFMNGCAFALLFMVHMKKVKLERYG